MSIHIVYVYVQMYLYIHMYLILPGLCQQPLLLKLYPHTGILSHLPQTI